MTELLIPWTNRDELTVFVNEVLFHSSRVGRISRAVGKTLGYDPATQYRLYLAGMWHDLGKLYMLDIIYDGELTSDQAHTLELHPVYSLNILLNNNSVSPDVANMVLYHHSHPDGTGYPAVSSQLADILQILSACDIFDAMTHDRHYRSKPKYSPLDAISYLESCGYSHGILDALSIVRPPTNAALYLPSNASISFDHDDGIHVSVMGGSSPDRMPVVSPESSSCDVSLPIDTTVNHG